MRAASEQEKFESQIDRMEKQYQKLIGEKRNTEEFEKYFKFIRDDDDVIAAVMPKNAVIEKEKKQNGLFCYRYGEKDERKNRTAFI